METINHTYINALLADAAYVEKLNEADNPGALVTALTGRMTIDLAEFIADNFTVLTQEDNNQDGGSSFDSTVWKGNAGTAYADQVYVSMRGSQ
ncbi:hypothetical protein AB835_11265 [Candidatus Endobugula sertula]|uniref:Uncharacterized protein n=1 Tax=Candidatus Endobugula sertula TaxID=62101 RepID=A0A1D2QN41_9GAMM|nr:hypothetical protein AB835_11265 [Candidatus Endobugula sertula]